MPTLSSWGNLDEGEKRRRLLCTSQKEKAYEREKRDESLKASFLEALKGTGEKAKDETVQNGNVSKRQRDQINIWGRNILVQAGSVGVLILLDNGDDQCDEFGPKIQILDAGSLLLWRHSALFGLGKQ